MKNKLEFSQIKVFTNYNINFFNLLFTNNKLNLYKLKSEVILMNDEVSLKIILDGKESMLAIDSTKTILDWALDNEIDAPYSCQGGACCTCIARLKNGEVEMSENSVLSQEEIDEGLILTCISTPKTKNILIDYDDI
tara:strand:- start:178 stop:588 length:411 start_codon:yes stop_codon:yes gene_type:complete